MSGGVDSSVAAALLCEQGYDVVGVTLHLWDYPDDGSEKGRCCAPEDQHDARRVADALNIPHFTFDRRELFRMQVVEPFVNAYTEGQTPSPCVACNRTVKMRELLALAPRLGASFVATGHYARVVWEHGKARLYSGIDRTKDQAYFLHMLRGDELARILFPLGESLKEQVRAEALKRALPGAAKGESQELCFVPTGHYGDFVNERVDPTRIRPGPIVDSEGREIGRHEGVHAFTIGQRKGLGVALGKPAYVLDIDAASATVRVGAQEGLLATGALLSGEGHIHDFSDDVSFPLEGVSVRVRARHEGEAASIEKRPDGKLLVRFITPVRAVSPGQMAVVYRGDRVLGGALIERPLFSPDPKLSEENDNPARTAAPGPAQGRASP